MEKKDAIRFVINALEIRCNMGYSINNILSKEGIEKLLFIENKKNPFHNNVEIDIFNYLRSKNCDMSEISFDEVDIFGLDFTGFKGVRINPFEKDLSMCIFNGVEFIGPFDGARIDTTDFTGSKNAVIDVSKLLEQSIASSNMCDVTFTGSFENADLYCTNFKGSNGAKINPNELGIEALAGTILEGVEFTQPISCCVDGADFTGSKNAVILSDEIDSFINTVLTDTIVIGGFNNKDCRGMVSDGAVFLGKIVEKRPCSNSKNKKYKGRHRR